MLIAIALAPVLAFAQGASATPQGLLPQTTLPVVFPHTISAARAHAGDVIEAKTTAPVRLRDDAVLPVGSVVTGHVVQADRFTFDKAPYATQEPGALAVRFESVSDRGTAVPLDVTVRAMADPLASWDTERPLETDIDSTHTTTQVGGDQVTPWIKEIRAASGNVVGYRHGGFPYAHLLAGPGCDGSNTEQAMGVFSASACGLYGFAETTLGKVSSAGASVVLMSNRRSPEIHANSMALLEESAAPVQTACALGQGVPPAVAVEI